MRQFGVKRENIDKEWLKSIHDQIIQGKITIKEASKNVHFIQDAPLVIEIHPNMLSKILEDNGMKIYARGRKGKTPYIDEELTMKVLEIYEDLQIGITKMFEYINKENIMGEHISKPKIEHIYNEFIREPQCSKVKKGKTIVRYVADKSNAIWHGDIHYLNLNGETKYIYAIIDDYSRFICCAEILESKSCEKVAECLVSACCNYTKPLIYWSDNGGENLGKEIKKVYKQWDICHIRTKPYNPAANGKIERWWQGVEKRIKRCQTWQEIDVAIKKFTEDYNNKIVHTGLPKKNGFHQYPAELFFDGSDPRYGAHILIDGKPIPLWTFIDDVDKHKDDITKLLN